VKILVDTESDKLEDVQKLIDFVYDKNPSDSRQKLILKCSDCDAEISQKVKDYSQDHYNKVLCYDCQQKEEL